jgi:UDP-N-acetylglucosamine 4,6-dehydratase/5-epimerase
MQKKLNNFFKNKTLLITGGTGSFGKTFVKTLLKKFDLKKIIIFSRDELKQSQMANELNSYKNKLRFYIGDVRDLPRIKLAMKNVNLVVHAAALKQVPTAEYNPFEVIKTNIIGTQNVIDAIIDSKVERAIALSTDKAAAPINLYGASKLAADKIFLASNNYLQKSFSVVRYGNVFGSRGSVVPLFINQAKKGTVQLTDEKMTRFTITINQGVEFVINCLGKMWGGELFVPKIPSYKIKDVLKAFAPKAKIKKIGLRAGEKMHEEMITNSDSYNTAEFKNYFVILPVVHDFINWKVKDFIRKSDSSPGKLCKKNFSYNSFNNSKYVTVEQLKKMIKDIEIID